MNKPFRLIVWLTLAALVAIVLYQHHSISELRQQLLAAAQPAVAAGPPIPAQHSEVQPAPKQDTEAQRLKAENEALRRELALARNHAGQWRQQTEEERTSSAAMSNLLAHAGHVVQTNSFQRTNTFSAQTLRDVGVGSLDAALETTLHALFSAEPLRTQTFVHPESLILQGGGVHILNDQRQELREASEIRVSNEADNFDGSIDLTLDIKYPPGKDGPNMLGVHMRPWKGGYRLDTFSPMRIILGDK